MPQSHFKTNVQVKVDGTKNKFEKRLILSKAAL